jgi:hypothetical protein
MTTEQHKYKVVVVVLVVVLVLVLMVVVFLVAEKRANCSILVSRDMWLCIVPLYLL